MVQRRKVSALAFLTLAIAAVIASSSGAASPDEAGLVTVEGDPVRGKSLFVNVGCGECHTLAAAGAVGQSGPSLDGEALTTALVATLVSAGADAMRPYGDRLSAQEIADIAAFVAQASNGDAAPTAPDPSTKTAGAQGADPTLEKGLALFQDYGCGNCHFLVAAAGYGDVGPSLDGNPDLTQARIRDRVTNGQGQMPAFGGQLSPEDIGVLAAYIKRVAKT